MTIVSSISSIPLMYQCAAFFALSLLVREIDHVESALYKPANQSGVYCSGSTCYDASLAVDGNVQTCAQPLTPALPGASVHSSQCWWMVDLGDLYQVFEVTIFNIAAGSRSYLFLTSFTISVGLSTNISSQSLCYTFYGVIAEGRNQTFTCSPQSPVGQYVSIQKFLSPTDPLSRPDTIILCEVMVAGVATYVFAVPSTSTTTTLSATTLTTTESSVVVTYNSLSTVNNSTHNSFQTDVVVAAIILATLLGLALLVIAVLILYIVKLQQQVRQLTVELNQTPTKEQHNYQHLHRDTPANQTVSNDRAQDALPYQQLHVAVANSMSSRAYQINYQLFRIKNAQLQYLAEM